MGRVTTYCGMITAFQWVRDQKSSRVEPRVMARNSVVPQPPMRSDAFSLSSRSIFSLAFETAITKFGLSEISDSLFCLRRSSVLLIASSQHKLLLTSENAVFSDVRNDAAVP
jgi:hypothetical protein